MKQTWINFLVVVGCFCLLFTLLLPAVRKSREDARRSQCKNNLKQWGLALHNYHDTYKMFPPYAGGTHENGERLSGRVMLISFLDSNPIWDEVKNSPGQGGDPMKLSAPSLPTELPVFLCPSSAIPVQVDQQPHASYVFNVGDQVVFNREFEYRDTKNVLLPPTNAADFPNRTTTSGAFSWRSCISIRDILDGTSNTFAMAERDLGNAWDQRDILGRVAGVAATSPADCVSLTSKRRYLPHVAILSELMGERWASGHPIYSVFLTAVPPNGPSCAASAPPSGASVGGWFTASSRHPGGCHVLLCDGAIRFINETINTGDLTAVGPKYVENKGELGGQHGWSGDVSSYGIGGSLGRMSDQPDGAF